MHICQPAVTLPTTPTSHELSVQNVSPMIACRFLECLRDGATAVCLWMARGLLGLAQTRKREIRGKQSKRAVGSVRSGFNLVWQRTEARQDAEVTLQNTVASVFVTRPDLLSRSVLTTSEVQVLLNTDRVMGHDHGFFCSWRICVSSPKGRYSSPSSPGFCFVLQANNIYFPEWENSSFSENHDGFLFSRKCLFGLSMLIKMVTSSCTFFFIKLWPTTNVLYC